nr:immunoglobulin heavy chain junction region [Macaca mulatta]MOX03431.1 immunoglobulin heavy chain junction region [Macaca mulatta]MOX05127.1 immunoglobulin heavy chain junction region [Macaca mulatta]MOX06156.1 immunoglobulin heavy chain junction region [Macaca mulatta]MOX06595.1 immunoglobulin heavy chain junction region [Macaca mulatta]
CARGGLALYYFDYW